MSTPVITIDDIPDTAPLNVLPQHLALAKQAQVAFFQNARIWRDPQAIPTPLRVRYKYGLPPPAHQLSLGAPVPIEDYADVIAHMGWDAAMIAAEGYVIQIGVPVI